MTPQPALASSGYCLAQTTDLKPEYLAYLPEPKPVKLDLRPVRRQLRVEWYDPDTEQLQQEARAAPGDWREFQPPCRGPALIHLAALGA
jgi:hypothetical protein